MDFSFNLKKIRKSKGYSQSQMAEILNIDIEKIRRIEQGKQKSIEFDFLEKIKLFFNCSWEELLG